MFFFNKTILLPNLPSLYLLLKNNINESLYECKWFYGDRIAIKHNSKNNFNKIRIWKTKSLFDIWFDPLKSCNFIAAIDFSINENNIKIEYIGINDFEHKNHFHYYNGDYNPKELIENRVLFIKEIAKKENKEKIILDVHENLRLFFKYYYYIGFNTTERKSKCNPFWIETEIIL